MRRNIDFSPAIIIKEKDGTTNVAIVVDNGPALMNDAKEYTNMFKEMIELFPFILTATFYSKNHTSYRLKVEGTRLMDIVGIKRFLLGDELL